MNPRKSIAALGDVMQLAFVPEDYDAALKFWVDTMGAGPFFAADHIKLHNLKYMGEPADIDFSLMIGYWGDIQIELLRQHNDTPSIYSAWRKQGREGLHHVCILVDDLVEARQICADAGAVIAQEATVPSGGEVIYVDTGGGPGTMVEILARGPRTDHYFATMREAAINWDRKDPVRRLR